MPLSHLRPSSLLCFAGLLGVLAFGLLTASPVHAQTGDSEIPTESESDDDRGFAFGPDYGLYFPTNSRTRDAFGSTWQNFGLGIGRLRGNSERGGFILDVDVISTRGSGRKAFLVPITAAYRRGFGDPKVRSVIPYIGANLGLYLADLRSDDYDVHSGFRAAFGGSVRAGFSVQRRFFLEAAYHGITKVKDFDLSGTNISAGYRIAF